jgi:hypothetical protein
MLAVSHIGSVKNFSLFLFGSALSGIRLSPPPFDIRVPDL